MKTKRINIEMALPKRLTKSVLKPKSGRGLPQSKTWRRKLRPEGSEAFGLRQPSFRAQGSAAAWSMVLAVLLLLAFTAASLSAAEATNKVAGGQTIVITSTNGAILDLEANKTIYYGNVRVSDREMELMCEQLTINFQTNNGTRQIESIVAETNVVIAQKDSWAFGDKAVYTITNDLFELSATTGEVLLDHPDFYLIGAVVVYDRKTGKFHAPGAVTVGGSAQAGAFGTNALGIGLPVRDNTRPPRPATPAPNTGTPQRPTP